MDRSLFLVLGNQLFPPEDLPLDRGTTVFLAEDAELCTYVRHHQQKLVLVLAAMRAYRDQLRSLQIPVIYGELEADGDFPYEDRLASACGQIDCTELVHYEVEGKAMERRLAAFAAAHGLTRRILPSPMFLVSRATFKTYLDRAARPRMASFYRDQRRRLELLLDREGKPLGGRWSHDADNRRPLPAETRVPPIAPAPSTPHVTAVQRLVARRFSTHPGSAEDMWLPTTRSQALDWLQRFLDERFNDFGPYEDALSTRSDTLFHSVLAPLLNIGLLTPREVVDRAIAHAADNEIPVNSLEGFIRQIIGWREFIRGIYQNYSEQQESTNFWGHRRGLTEHWYEATTGIVPLDDAIDATLRLGWTHHIPRLMVIGNLMTLCEIEPRVAHRWFMEMFVDAANWVMGPNVYGMALFSDGGIFATKPYLCGSNYLLKMSDYPRGEWCDVVDGLYWRFIEQHRDFFSSNPRLAMIARGVRRLKPERRERIFRAAEQFLATRTSG